MPRRASCALEVTESSQIGAARRTASVFADEIGMSSEQVSQVAIIATELASNLLKHAQRGRLVIDLAQDGESVELLALDHGPGMDVERCFVDGYSTTGTAGTGLGAVRRLASEIDAYSQPRGSVIYARVGPPVDGRRVIGAIATPITGETVSGDAFSWIACADGWGLLVADGLGHGPEAAAAARAAADTHAVYVDDPVQCLLLAHERSRPTRGSVCAAVRWFASDRRLLHAGVGNIATTLVGATASKGLPSQNGTVGTICPRIQANTATVEPGTLVIMHSDGLTSRWNLADYPGLSSRHPKIIAGVLLRDANRQRDDATIVVVRT